MLLPVPTADLTSRFRSLPLVAGTAVALLVLTAASASAQGPGGAAALVGDEQSQVQVQVQVQVQPAIAAPGAAPQPVAGGIAPSAPVSTAVGETAQLAGVQALAPTVAPPEVLAAVTAANSIVGLPYKWGGGHGSFDDTGYDCSGSVSKVLNAIGALEDPMDSSRLKHWGERGKGQWITVYTNSGHAYMVIAGLRFDTSGRGGRGPRWRTGSRPSSGFVARHPEGL
jgi:cell wall-associated NlpC family hydrolase